MLLLVIVFLSLLFFCYGYRDPRGLHSFPTRRSSDLTRGCSPRGTRQRTSGLSGRCTARRRCTKDRSDRKSTRLNSSHRCISYAVFCLKKKKKHAIAPITHSFATLQPNNIPLSYPWHH